MGSTSTIGDGVVGEGESVADAATVGAPSFDGSALEQLREAVGGDSAFVAELITAYLADSVTQLTAMAGALGAGDAPTLERAAHSLKSNSASFGALALAAACRELETAARSGALDAAGGLLARVEAEYQRAVGSLEAARAAERQKGAPAQ